MHRNDMENIPPFLVAGLLFVATDPPPLTAQALFAAYVVSRLLHAWAYGTARSHETRAAFWTVGSLIVIAMALHVAVAALG